MVLDDEPAIGRAVQRNLTSDRFKIELAYEVEPVLARLQAGHGDWDVFILDINLRGGIDGIEVLHLLRRSSARTSVVMISGNDSATTAAACLRAGAFDYLTKPIRQTDLSAAVSKAASHAWAQRARAVPRAPGELPGSTLSELVGSSAVMQQTRNLVRRIAASDDSILVQGETGTGKELVARAIHDQSERREHRFVPINCAIDGAPFGCGRGVSSCAFDDYPAAFAEATGGTLFLDKIDELPLPAQVRLLRAVEELKAPPAGAASDGRSDVRIISATQVDLAAAGKERFRSDLLYRLDVIRVTMPPLRDHIEDVPELVAHFLHKHGQRRARPPRPIPTVDRSTIEVLMSCAWPGNVRQLENAIRSAIALCDGNVIHPSHLPDLVAPHSISVGSAASLGSWRPLGDGSATRTGGDTEPSITASFLVASAATTPSCSSSSTSSTSLLAGAPGDGNDTMDSTADPGDASDPTMSEINREIWREVISASTEEEITLMDLDDLDGKEPPQIAEVARRLQWTIRRRYFHYLMLKVNGNLTQAARLARLDRANLRRQLRALGLNADDYRDQTDG